MLVRLYCCLYLSGHYQAHGKIKKVSKVTICEFYLSFVSSITKTSKQSESSSIILEIKLFLELSD